LEFGALWEMKMPTHEHPSPALWRRLYTLAGQLGSMQPWDWMDETDVFGVQDPATGELGFVSMMGALGEHRALALYRGAGALYEFWELEDEDSDYWPTEHLLEIPQLQVSLENRDELEPSDRALVRKLGLNLRGRHSWPMFRSFRPGYAPWVLDASEARFLAHALEQALAMAERFKVNDSLFDLGDDETYLVRTSHMHQDQLLWEDSAMSIAPPPRPPLNLQMDNDALAALKALPKQAIEIEAALTIVPARIQERANVRPRFPYTLLLVDAKTGFVYTTDVLSIETTLEEMWERVPLTFVHELARIKMVPQTVVVSTGFLFELIAPVSAELGFQLKLADSLPALEAAQEFMLATFRSD
jgi:hypothetical protein